MLLDLRLLGQSVSSAYIQSPHSSFHGRRESPDQACQGFDFAADNSRLGPCLAHSRRARVDFVEVVGSRYSQSDQYYQKAWKSLRILVPVDHRTCAGPGAGQAARCSLCSLGFTQSSPFVLSSLYVSEAPAGPLSKSRQPSSSPPRTLTAASAGVYQSNLGPIFIGSSATDSTNRSRTSLCSNSRMHGQRVIVFEHPMARPVIPNTG